MKLYAKVTRIESGKEYTDGQRRITLKVKGAGMMQDKITVANDDLNLDDELELELFPLPSLTGSAA